MNLLLRRLALVTILVLSVAGLKAQRYDPDSLWNIQPPSDTVFQSILLNGHWGKAFHIATDLQCRDGNCKPFEGGMGNSYGIGVTCFQEYEKYLNLSVGLGINFWDVGMTTTDSAARVRMPDGSISNIVRELTMNAHGMALGITAGALYKRDNWLLSLSPVLELNASAPRWSQTGRILSPSGVVYPDGTTSTVIVEEEPVPDASSLRFGLNASVGHEIAVNSSLSIVPTLTVQYMPTAIRSSASWSDARVVGSVAVRINADRYPDTVERVRTTIKIDTVRTVRPANRVDTLLVFGESATASDTLIDGLLRKISTRITRTDTLVALDSILQRSIDRTRRRDSVKNVEAKRPAPVISIGGKSLRLKTKSARDTALQNRSFIITEDGDTLDYSNKDIAEELAIKLNTERRQLTFMVMPSIFFDSGSSRIPDRYRRLKDTIGYDPGQSGKSQHELNLDILNVMGFRLRQFAENLIIRGYADESSEGGSCELARARAQSIVDFMSSIWGIDPARLRVDVASGVCLANPASSGASARGREENRRVDIFSSDNQYFQPVQRTDVVTKADWDASQASFTVSDTLDPVIAWKYEYKQNDRIILTRSGTGAFEETSLSLPRNVLDSLSKEPVVLVVTMTTRSGEELISDISIPVSSFDTDIKFESLSLAMFAVRATDLGQRDVDLLKLFAERLSKGDRVAVIGYSDDLGNPAQNQQLSQRRAESVAAQLRNLRPDCEVTRVEGLGSTRFPIGVFSYNFPEQRFMSRTVQLVLEKQ